LNLYLDVDQYKKITAYLEESGGEFANDKQESAFDRLGWSLDENLIDAIKGWKELRKSVDSVKIELKRLSDYKVSEEKKFNALTSLLMDAMNVKGVTRFGAGLNSMSLAKCPPSLPLAEDIDDNLIPDCFRKELPKKGPVMRSLLLKAVKDGVVMDIELVTDKVRLKVI